MAALILSEARARGCGNETFLAFTQIMLGRIVGAGCSMTYWYCKRVAGCSGCSGGTVGARRCYLGMMSKGMR